VIFSGSTSGTTTLNPTAIAGSTTLTLPAATDTLIGKATTDTLTNKTYDTAGTGNSFSIAGVAVTANQGTGSVVRATSPTLTTPVLGVATATSINGNTFTTGTYTLTGTAGKTLTFNNSITLAGTDATTMTFPTTSKTLAANDGSNWTLASQAIGDLAVASSTTAYARLAAVAVGQVLVSAGTGTAPAYSANPQVTTIELGAATDTTLSRVSAGVIAVEGVTVPTISSTNTLTNKRVTRRLTTVSGPGATPSTNTDNMDIANFTALAAAITSMTTNLTGTPVDGDLIEFRFTDNGTARAITWGASFAATTVALPTTTVISTMLRALFEWNSTAAVWQCIATA
jgi:hypothetical protein